MKIFKKRKFFLALLTGTFLMGSFQSEAFSKEFNYIAQNKVEGTLLKSEMKYHELAAHIIPSNIDDLTLELEAFTEDTLPHEAKLLRKSVGKLRSYLELFIFAYPTYGGEDPLRKARKVLDSGYEGLGNFKDLFDIKGVSVSSLDKSPYDMKEVSKRRNISLKWKEKYAKKILSLKTLHYLKNPIPSYIEDRKEKHLPKYYWRIVDFEPQIEETAYSNFLLLGADLLEESLADYPEVLKIDEIIPYENQEAFHDLRKKVRSVLKLKSYFKGLWPKSCSESNEAALTKKMVSKFGDLNDKLVALKNLEEQLDKRRLGATKKKELQKAIKAKTTLIDSEWLTLKKWIKANLIDSQIEGLSECLRES